MLDAWTAFQLFIFIKVITSIFYVFFYTLQNMAILIFKYCSLFGQLILEWEFC